MTLHAARVLEKRDVGGGLTLVSLAIDDAARASYTIPGQYIDLTIAGKNGYFALASEALAAPWELLVKDSGDASTDILHADIGASVTVSEALGAGFSVATAGGRPAVIAVSGSAVSAARSLLSWRRARGELARTFVFVGARSVADAPIREELSRWGEEGAHVTLAVSRESESAHPGVKVVRGYVQNALISAALSGEIPRDAIVFVAGHDAIAIALREATALSSVYTNV